MKEQFLQKLVAQPLEMSRPRARTFLAAAVQRLRSERPEEDVFGDPLPTMRIEGDVAVIPIRGVLALNLPDWVKAYGLNLTDIDDIAQELTTAQQDPRVAFTVLDLDSPGGWSIAGQKLFDTVERAAARPSAKPIFAWCADGAEACSAAYHGAMPARMFLTGPYATTVGCIGTYLALHDDTEFWRMMGITIEVLRSGEQKGAGIDGFSEAQRDWLQSQVDECGALFRRHVSTYRTQLDPAELEGQYYPGDQAARRHFTHGLAADLPAALTKFRRQL